MDQLAYTVPQTAALLGRSPGWVRSCIHQGALRAVRRGERGRWLVTRDALLAFIGEPDPVLTPARVDVMPRHVAPLRGRGA